MAAGIINKTRAGIIRLEYLMQMIGRILGREIKYRIEIITLIKELNISA